MRELRAGLMLLSVAGLLAGCGSSGGDDGDGGDGGAFAALEAEADSLVNETQDLAYTDPATLPTTGAATFDGVVGLDLKSIPNETLQDADMAGELSLTVNFARAGNPVTGTASDFVGIDDSEFDGTLIIDQGTLDRRADPDTEDTFTAAMAGELTGEDGTAWTIETDLTGDFAGEGHSHALGEVAGTGCTNSACTSVEGGFIAER